MIDKLPSTHALKECQKSSKDWIEVVPKEFRDDFHVQLNYNTKYFNVSNPIGMKFKYFYKEKDGRHNKNILRLR